MKIRCIKHFDRQGSVLVMYRLNKKFQLIMIGVETSPTTVVHSVGLVVELVLVLVMVVVVEVVVVVMVVVVVVVVVVMV